MTFGRAKRAVAIALGSARRLSRHAIVLAGLIAAICPATVLAYDGDNPWLQFGPVGNGSRSGDGSDREFIKDWEANPQPGFPTLSKANIEPTKAAIKRYSEIVQAGGWPTLPPTQMKAGQSGGAIALLRRRLAASGDLKDAGSSDSFDYDVEKAVQRFQTANGMPPTGVTDKRTIAALNVPAAIRLRQLKANLGRLTAFSGASAKKYVVVNIPAAQIEAIENGKVVSRHSGVVGKIDRPTPILSSAIHEMNFNPTWRLPPTVISKDLIPKGREMQKKNQSVLVKFGIDAYDGNGRKLDPEKINWNSGQPTGLSYSQKPGKDNPLGFLKINFHNSYSVYMHDTPKDSIFGRSLRAASSGCIRVQNIKELAAWLLEDRGEWSMARIEHVKETGERHDVAMKKPVPLHFVYITAWATEDGVVQFRNDIYNKDGAGESVSAN